MNYLKTREIPYLSEAVTEGADNNFTGVNTFNGLTYFKSSIDVERDDGAATLYLRSIIDANAPNIYFEKAGTGLAPVTSNQTLGIIRGLGYDGSGYTNATRIEFSSDGTIGTGIVPGRIEFHTADAAGSVAERVRIRSSGGLNVGTGLYVGSLTGTIEDNKIFAEDDIRTNGGLVAGSISQDIAAGMLYLSDGNIHSPNTIDFLNDTAAQGIRVGGIYCSTGYSGTWGNGRGYFLDYVRADGGLTTDATDPGTGNLYIAGTGRIVDDVAISGALNVGRISTQGTNGWIYSYGAQQGWIASAVAGDYSARWYADIANRWYTPDNLYVGGYIISSAGISTDTSSAGTGNLRVSGRGYTLGGFCVGSNNDPGTDNLRVDGTSTMYGALNVSGANISCLSGVLSSGGNDSQYGDIRAYGHSTAQGGIVRIYAGATCDANNDRWDIVPTDAGSNENYLNFSGIGGTGPPGSMLALFSTGSVHVANSTTGSYCAMQTDHLNVGYDATTKSTYMTRGLKLHQGGYTDHILELYNVNVNHNITSWHHPDCYASFAQYYSSNQDGGLSIFGISNQGDASNYVGLHLAGLAGYQSNTKSTAAKGAINIDGAIPSGNTGTGLSSGYNVVSIASWGACRFVFANDGDIYADATYNSNSWDELEDAEMIRALEVSRSKAGIIRNEFDKFLQYNRKDIENAGLATFNDGENEDGSTFVNYTGLTRLHSGAIWQLYTKIMRVVNELDAKGIIDKKELLAP